MRDPQELQKEADAIRADLARTLAALEHRLSPREIANRSVDLVRRRGTTMLHKAGEAAAKHPIPVLLASAGIVWLASSKRNARAAQPRDLRSRSKDWIETATAFAPNAIGAAKRVARKATRGNGSRLTRMIRNNPVLCGTLAAAVGAAISSAVPTTRYEREAAGPLLERAAQTLQRLASMRR